MAKPITTWEFDANDWLSDEKLMAAALTTQAIWFKLLCYMRKDDRNHEVVRSPQHLANMTSATDGQIQTFIYDAIELKFCDIFFEFKDEENTRPRVDSIQNIRVVSRRFLRENQQREKWKNQKKNQRIPIKEIVELYHSTLPELSTIRELNTVSEKIRARWNEKVERQSLDWWESFFTNEIAASDFLMGRVNNFQCNLGWIVGPINFAKIRNGQYVNRGFKSTGSKRTDNNISVAEGFING